MIMRNIRTSFFHIEGHGYPSITVNRSNRLESLAFRDIFSIIYVEISMFLFSGRREWFEDIPTRVGDGSLLVLTSGLIFSLTSNEIYSPALLDVKYVPVYVGEMREIYSLTRII